MKTFVCIAVLVACALAAPAPEAGRREKRSGWGAALALGYSLPAPLVSHAALYAEPAAIVHEPAVVSVKKFVSAPELVSVKKIVSYPHVTRVAHYVAPSVTRVAHYSAPLVTRVAQYSAPLVTRVAHYSAPRLSVSYAPAYSAGWW